MLQAASETPHGRLELVDDSPLTEYRLPASFSQQHVAVQYTQMVAALLAAK